jgi:hypothetical protein
MPKTDKQKKYTKSDLPLKICVDYNRSFVGRGALGKSLEPGKILRQTLPDEQKKRIAKEISLFSFRCSATC